MSEVSAQTLHVVSKELSSTLNEARVALENFAEHPDNVQLLEQCAVHLHQAHGVLRLVEVYGASLLAEEMEQVTRYLIQSEKKSQTEGLDALMRAMVQLPAYLERVLSGGRDLALVLLPLLNDLRAVRGNSLLSEGTLLLLNLRSDQQAAPVPPRAGEPPMTVTQWARRLRARFQAGLIGWIRGERTAQNLEILARVAEKLEQVATTQPVFQLWWVVGAVLEALREKGLAETATVKRLMGLADRQVKRLYDVGESRYSEHPPVDLLNNLLYYVARATSSGVRVMAVRASFKLAELLPVDDSVEQERESLSAPSVKLMRTVGAAIKEDLTKVKDVLDIFVRKGGTQIEELAPQIEMLRKISDTLGVLGLGGLRSKVQTEIQHLQTLVAGGAQLTDNTLVEIAATLISVEDSLDDQLVRLIMPGPAPAEVPESESEVISADDTDYRQVTEAVIRECIVNLARVKETITQALQKPGEAQGLDAVPGLLRGINAGLQMLGKARAVEIVEKVGAQVQAMLEPGSQYAADRLDRLADAIVSIEYYMETVQSGRSDPWYMLDNAETCLKALELLPAPIPTGLPDDPGVHTRTIAIDRTKQTVAALTRPGTPDLAATHANDPGATYPVMKTPDAEQLDPEFVALFIEEAREEIASINRQFPLWDQNPGDSEALVNVRRSFHTLKGSGRMVGAQLIGEFAWSVENLLNRIINKTLVRTPGMMSVLREGVAGLPALVDQLESGGDQPPGVNSLMNRAHAYAEGREPDSGAGAAADDLGLPDAFAESTSLSATSGGSPLGAAAPKPHPIAPARPAMDPVLHEIYSRETAGHLASIRDFLARCGGLPPPWAVPEAIYRACHTLSGSSKMAEARQGIKIAEPLNQYMRKVFENGTGLDREGLAVLGDAVRAIDDVVANINEATGYFMRHHGLVERIRQLEERLDEELAQRQLSASLPSLQPQTLAPESLGDLDAPAELPALFAEEPPAEESSSLDIVLSGDAEPVATDASVELDFVLPEEPPEESQAIAAEFEIPAEVAASEEQDDDDDSADAEYDADIAAIFSEEATELLEAADVSLRDWNGSRNDKERAFELKRQLHTLKGGARMAGIKAMGDLSHELETLVIQIDAGLVPGSDAAFEVLQLSIDELSRMRDAVSAGRRVTPARDALRRIRVLSHGQPQIEEEPVVRPAPRASAVHAPIPSTTSEPPRREAPQSTFVAPSPPPRAPEPPPVVTPPAPPPRPTPDVFAPAVRAPTPPPYVAPAASLPSASLESADEADGEMEEGESVPAVLPPGREAQQAPERQEMARVDADLLDTLLNNAGEVSIFRSRLEQQVSSIDFNLAELTRTVTRLKEQLRKLEMETEAQILHRHHDEGGTRREEFDPLELDRYSAIQQFSRALAEGASDVGSIQGLLENLTRETHNLLMQQARVITELQNGLMRTRMVPFSRHAQRLSRIVRQMASELGKKVELGIEGAAGELDRQVLERMLPPFEHMLRNAVVHGIETPAERLAANKSETGKILVNLHREGAEVVIVVRDDGAGLNVKAIRDKAVSMGLVDPRQSLTDEEAMQLILEPGFSTAGKLTQAAGRGVGMDVVATEVKKLGGALFIESTHGVGSTFTIRLPFTLAISQALIVRVVDELYALPLPTVEGVVRLTKDEVMRHLHEETPSFEYGGQKYRFQHLGAFVGGGPSLLPEQDVSVPIILVRAAEHSTALVTDELVGSREIVVKSVGPQISGIRGISGATILGDGRIVIILDVGALVRSEWRTRPALDMSARDRVDNRTFALVVDDSITVRRVTQRLLERNGMRVMTAKDGVDAVSILQEHIPDVILLDIEMPRMDGYEVASHVRNDQRLRDVPIVMITSRVGEKHRARAIEIGVNDYLGKPYQEAQLLDAIEPLVQRRRRAAS